MSIYPYLSKILGMCKGFRSQRAPANGAPAKSLVQLKQHCKQASGNTDPTTVDTKLSCAVVSTILCVPVLAVHVRF